MYKARYISTWKQGVVGPFDHRDVAISAAKAEIDSDPEWPGLGAIYLIHPNGEEEFVTGNIQ